MDRLEHISVVDIILLQTLRWICMMTELLRAFLLASTFITLCNRYGDVERVVNIQQLGTTDCQHERYLLRTSPGGLGFLKANAT